MSPSPSASAQVDLDSYFADPISVDPEFPPYHTRFSVVSEGSNVRAKVWLAAGPGDKGTVIINPPMGGSETMNSNIIPLLYAGMNVITSIPTGVRDPENTYNMAKVIDDLHAIVAWIVANSGAEKKAPFGPTWRFDPGRICVMGLSGGGGNNSYAVCAESKHVNYAIAIAPGNPDLQMTPEMIEKMMPMYNRVKEATLGRSDWVAWMRAMSPADKKRISIIQNAPKLVDKHLLLIGGTHDMVSPINIAHYPNLTALREAGVRDLTPLLFETDHGHTTKRYSLPRTLIGWLKQRGF